MKKQITLLTIIVLISSVLSAQTTDADKFRIDKSKINSKLEKLALTQLTVSYKLTTTTKTQAQEKSSKMVAGARVTAYLETTDGELTDVDFQEVTDYFYSYFQKTLKENGIDTVAWSKITATDFYNSGKMENEEKDTKDANDGNVWVTSTAHKGNILHGKELAFAFGKIKKASAFCEEIGAPAAFFYVTLDFADVMVNLDLKTVQQYNNSGFGYYSPQITQKKITWAINPEMRAGQSDLGFPLFWNEKSQSELIFQDKDIEAKGIKYHDTIGEDMTKARTGLAKQFAFRKELTPVLIQTTKDKYKEAAKKSLEKYADAYVAKVKQLKKGKS